MQVISLFSGIGGFELAAEWMGWLNIASCEINPFGQKVLKHYWPNAYHHDDIKTMNYDEIRDRINPQIPTVVVGGFPCQPYSTAGKRLGKDDERHLWPYCVRTVQQIRPNYCVFENVRGLTNWNGGMVFDEVQSDLEAEGYEVLPFLLPACAVNAPHRRDRIWFIAYSNYKGGGDGSSEVPNKNGEVSQWHNDAESGNADQRSVADTDSGRDTRHRDESRIATSAEQGREDNEGIFLNNGGELNAANSVSIGQQGQRGMHNPAIQRRVEMGKQIGLTMIMNDGKGSQLNPRFVGEMMGFPPNWLELPFQSTDKNP